MRPWVFKSASSIVKLARANAENRTEDNALLYDALRPSSS